MKTDDMGFMVSADFASAMSLQLKAYATVSLFFSSNNRFLSNLLYDNNIMLWNEKPNKNETLPGSFFMRYHRFHIFNIFYDFHRLL